MKTFIVTFICAANDVVQAQIVSGEDARDAVTRRVRMLSLNALNDDLVGSQITAVEDIRSMRGTHFIGDNRHFTLTKTYLGWEIA